jgi:hypothetical protein
MQKDFPGRFAVAKVIFTVALSWQATFLAPYALFSILIGFATASSDISWYVDGLISAGLTVCVALGIWATWDIGFPQRRLALLVAALALVFNAFWILSLFPAED